MASFTNSKYQFLCAVLVLLHTRVLCFQYKVGDLDAWGIPTSGNRHVYTNWAQKHHFQIGDSLCKLIFLHSIFRVREKWRQNQKTHIRSWYFTPFLVNKTRPISIFLFCLHHFSPKTQNANDISTFLIGIIYFCSVCSVSLSTQSRFCDSSNRSSLQHLQHLRPDSVPARW